PATILGDIPEGQFVQGPATVSLDGAQGSVGPIPVPPGLNQVDVIVTLSYEATGSMVTTDCDNPFVRGDLSGDDVVNLGDMIGLLGFLFGFTPAPNPIDIADLNADGQTNLGDAIAGLQFLFNDGPPPAAPYPNPGCP
ncbi:MAG: hypothetical protein KDC38_05510, partial [Planctomycetes bacterium]|nr:hypothetical protein [Planctomycetota bacterium]